MWVWFGVGFGMARGLIGLRSGQSRLQWIQSTQALAEESLGGPMASGLKKSEHMYISDERIF